MEPSNIRAFFEGTFFWVEPTNVRERLTDSHLVFWIGVFGVLKPGFSYRWEPLLESPPIQATNWKAEIRGKRAPFFLGGVFLLFFFSFLFFLFAFGFSVFGDKLDSLGICPDSDLELRNFRHADPLEGLFWRQVVFWFGLKGRLKGKPAFKATLKGTLREH